MIGFLYLPFIVSFAFISIFLFSISSAAREANRFVAILFCLQIQIQIFLFPIKEPFGQNNARKQDGDHYKATSFENIRHALNRHLQSVPYNRKMDIIKDTEFADANVCFKAALAKLSLIFSNDVAL
jgi:hypothetical protein